MSFHQKLYCNRTRRHITPYNNRKKIGLAGGGCGAGSVETITGYLRNCNLPAKNNFSTYSGASGAMWLFPVFRLNLTDNTNDNRKEKLCGQYVPPESLDFCDVCKPYNGEPCSETCLTSHRRGTQNKYLGELLYRFTASGLLGLDLSLAVLTMFEEFIFNIVKCESEGLLHDDLRRCILDGAFEQNWTDLVAVPLKQLMCELGEMWGFNKKLQILGIGSFIKTCNSPVQDEDICKDADLPTVPPYKRYYLLLQSNANDEFSQISIKPFTDKTTNISWTVNNFSDPSVNIIPSYIQVDSINIIAECCNFIGVGMVDYACFGIPSGIQCLTGSQPIIRPDYCQNSLPTPKPTSDTPSSVNTLLVKHNVSTSDTPVSIADVNYISPFLNLRASNDFDGSDASVVPVSGGVVDGGTLDDTAVINLLVSGIDTIIYFDISPGNINSIERLFGCVQDPTNPVNDTNLHVFDNARMGELRDQLIYTANNSTDDGYYGASFAYLSKVQVVPNYAYGVVPGSKGPQNTNNTTPIIPNAVDFVVVRMVLPIDQTDTPTIRQTSWYNNLPEIIRNYLQQRNNPTEKFLSEGCSGLSISNLSIEDLAYDTLRDSYIISNYTAWQMDTIKKYTEQHRGQDSERGKINQQVYDILFN